MEEIKRNTIKRLEEAGELFLSEVLYHQTTAKAGVANFVTQVDYRVQDYMVKALSDILPGSNIITEESNRNDYHFTRPTWILDPVDGTTNLMHQYRHSAISLALILDGQLSLSFIYNPFTREMFIGQNKKGAWLNDKPIRVSTSASLAESLICFGTTPYDRQKAERTFKIVYDVFMRSQDIRRSGSAALDIAYVACGRLDGFFEMNLQPWDYAAGSLLLKEAGGCITNWQGENVNLLASDSVIATNGLIHKSLMELFRT